MKKRLSFLLFLLLPFAPLRGQEYAEVFDLLIEVPEGKPTESVLIAIDRIRDYSAAAIQVLPTPASAEERAKYDLTVVLGMPDNSAELSKAWKKHPADHTDSYLIQSISSKPNIVLASGLSLRSTIYAAYRVADMLKQGAEFANLDLFFLPKIAQRYVSFGATTHGRKYYNPALYYRTLKELPRFGYNGVLIYPGGGTPIGRRASPVLETAEGKLYLTDENTSEWKHWFREVDKYGHDIIMTIPPMIPPGYASKAVKDFYAGGPEPAGYINDLKSHYKEFLTLLRPNFPEIDGYLFNSTEGATFGNNERFFGAPDLKRFSNKSYLANNEKIMRAYFDVLHDFFQDDIKKVSFWTHSFGLTSDGIKKMREVLFQYPQVQIIEDDYWNNNLWPMDIPSMKYLPEDLRAKIHTRNPYGLFQIATDGEYYGGGSLPTAYTKSHVRSAKDALNRNAKTVIQRLDLHDRTPQGTAFGIMEIVPLVASRQFWTPVEEESLLWVSWAERRFGKQAAPHVIKALNESEQVILKGLSCNGIDMLAVGSEFKSDLWTIKNDLSRFHLFSKPGRLLVAKTEGDVITSPEYTAYQMGTKTIPVKSFREDQDMAMRSALNGLQQIENAKPHLSLEDYRMLKGVFINGTNVLKAMRLLGEAAYATNILMSNFDNIRNPEGQFIASISNLESFIHQSPLVPTMTENLRAILDDYKRAGTRVLKN